MPDMKFGKHVAYGLIHLATESLDASKYCQSMNRFHLVTRKVSIGRKFCGQEL